MNRRKFFGFLAAAPVVVPAAVMAAKPTYAKGGFVRGVPVGLTGEGAVPEAIMPLSRAQTVNVVVNVTGASDFKLTSRQIAQHIRRTLTRAL